MDVGSGLELNSELRYAFSHYRNSPCFGAEPPRFARLNSCEPGHVLMLASLCLVLRNQVASDRVSCVLESRFTTSNAQLVPQFYPRLSPRKPWPTRSREDRFLPQAGDGLQQRHLPQTRYGLPSLIGGCSSVFSRTRLALLCGVDQTSSRPKSCRRLHVVKRT
jgi:hypothetical protein